MKQNIIQNILVVAIASTLFACSSANKSTEDEVKQTEGVIYLTNEQFESEQIKIGRPQSVVFQTSIDCNGYISAEPNGVAKLNTILTGRVEAIDVVVGQKVKKGERIALLSSSALIELQQQFKRSSALKKKQLADYERVKALYQNSIGSKKEFQLVESEYNLVVADYKALLLQLKRLNLNVDAIEGGDIVDAYPLVAPVSGEVTQLELVLGDFVEPQEDVAEIVDPNRLQLSLSVFEKDVPYLTSGNKVVFQVQNNKSMYTASLGAIARRVQDDSKAIECKASIDSLDQANFIYKSYVQAKIVTNEKEALGIPVEAIVKLGDERYYFVVNNKDDQGYYIKKRQVRSGEEHNGFIEIKEISADEQVLLSGVYNLPVD